MLRLLLSLFLVACLALGGQAQSLAERPAASGDEARTVTVFPNPSAGILHITATGFDGKIELRLLNVIGNVVYRESLNETEARFNRTLDLGELAAGLYYLKIESGAHSEMRKVVIR